jgi:hypothetical protein
MDGKIHCTVLVSAGSHCTEVGVKTFLALAAVTLLGLTGCNGDSITGLESFRVTLTVTDPSGVPVEGLQFSAAPDLPQFYQDEGSTAALEPEDGEIRVFPSPFYPVAAIEFVSKLPSHATLTIEDVDGQRVDTLLDERIIAGPWRMKWDGKTTPDGPSPGGVYFARLRLVSDGKLRHEELEPMLYVPLYPEQHSIGATDSRGRLVLEDSRLFPQLYDVPDIAARDETGAVVAMIELGPAMRFYALDPVTGQIQRFDRDVDGSCELEMVWEPEI